MQIGDSRKLHITLSVVSKGRCCCQFMLRLQKEETLINPKPKNYV